MAIVVVNRSLVGVSTVRWPEMIRGCDMAIVVRWSEMFEGCDIARVISKQVIDACDSQTNRLLKASFSFHNITKRQTQITILYTNLSLYITFIMIYYIRQE